MSLTFSDLLAADSVHVDVPAGSKKHTLQILSEHLAEAASETTADDVFDALIERERLGCTAAESGMAVPHATIPGLTASRAVLLRLENPVDFDGAELPEVDLVFGFIAPKDSSDELADDLRRLTRAIADPALGERLRQAAGAQEIYDILADADEVLADATNSFDSAAAS